jgi:hypothetical protein
MAVEPPARTLTQLRAGAPFGLTRKELKDIGEALLYLAPAGLVRRVRVVPLIRAALSFQHEPDGNRSALPLDQYVELSFGRSEWHARDGAVRAVHGPPGVALSARAGVLAIRARAIRVFRTMIAKHDRGSAAVGR